MIELTDQQRRAIANGKAIRVRENGHEYILLRADIFEELSEEMDGPWTGEERDLLREEAVDLLDNYGKQP